MNYEELAKRLMDEPMNYPLRKEAADAIQRLTKERDEARNRCKMAWTQGFCYGDPEYYPPPAALEESK